MGLLQGDESTEPASPDWAPADVDTRRPTAARAYDYLLGGCHNFAADRELIAQGLAIMPDLAIQAQANRSFLHRAVRHLAEAGVRQFLDIGSGIPTLGNVHEVAQRIAPESRVVYVDIDPVAVQHSQQILAGNERATVIQEDLRRPAAILAHPQVRAMLDFSQPVGLLLVAILHVIPDADDPHGILATLREAMVPGSYLVIGHGTHDSRPEAVELMRQLSEKTPTAMTLRSRAQIEPFFTGFELVEPGLVWAPQWRPESPDDVGDHPELASNLVGVGRRR